ncbi:archaetidylserine decarboxylase [Bradymonas sediminis]|uniref:phosphatidylserine decarboxylase n=1 Tax=Bradymonas sediminis TaxID=1548548 RepID=A0A2Z4FKB6_9DELT|nr:archaetidylserine decarboxylase [Bradymonas sediminis]AWV89417.1 phosphatidylserine decarboxylase [Bradymonas sediminis]TDP73599.1 phosphatidylserine decarboxylase [Bradymonas sediminis]
MVMERVAVQALKLLPKNFVSRAFGAVSDVEFPAPFQTTVNRVFADLVGADLSESEQEPNAYPSLNSFFTRKLRDGVRPVSTDDPSAAVSPVDGVLSNFGPIVNDTLIQAKGREYRLGDLVDSGAQRKVFEGGHYATIYLSPRDYHRIHSPTSGSVTRVSYIPGHLFPVNSLAVRNIDELFAVNERLISYMENPKMGRVGVVKVGATCVGRIGVSFHEVETNLKFRRRREIEMETPIEVAHGDELGLFNLGSTVIVLIEHPDFQFDPTLTQGQHLKMGQFLGEIVS